MGLVPMSLRVERIWAGGVLENVNFAPSVSLTIRTASDARPLSLRPHPLRGRRLGQDSGALPG
ncbi:hypothetical protein GA0115260_119843 [Streptomyces sp. MnatMP-M27]|nr:hypothetical protein GA0115260_119843 [Streptomyces sp. MnatMP-M27]